MNKWIAEFDLEDGDTMPEHMDLEYKGAKLDFHCRPMWIPVSEKMPEDSGHYLITYCYQDEIETSEAVYVKDEEEDKWYDITDVEITLAVIAWMPLPEPYRLESEEQT